MKLLSNAFVDGSVRAEAEMPTNCWQYLVPEAVRGANKP